MTMVNATNHSYLVIIIVSVVFINTVSTFHASIDEADPGTWFRIGQEELSRALKRQPINKRAKNVILFVGDGMGVSTVTAARIYQGQMMNKSGEEGLLFFERFPNIAHTKTYSVDKQTPDSAGTATAFLCGVKTNYGTIGVDATVIRHNCSGQAGHELSSILHWSQNVGKHVGVVTNTRITHATPAATYAHSADRGWESDADMMGVEGGCKDIARQLVEDNPDIRVILGGGRYNFLPYDVPDPETEELDVNRRHDGRNLIETWLKDKKERNFQAQYVWNASSFYQLDNSKTDFLLGLFEDTHMDYEYVRTSEPDPEHWESGEPSLAEMTATAINILTKAHHGFFLFVEGGRIDHAHHSNRAKLSLVDTMSFDLAVRTAAEMTSPEDTLIVVTADHSHVFMIGGYPSRGNSITGEEDMNLGDDGLPYTTLLYGNGPGYSHYNGSREDITYTDVEDIYYRQQAAVPLHSETHAGEDVAVYARGPMGHLFHATHEQSYLAYVMAYASCVGAYAKDSDCAAALEPTTSSPNSVTSYYTTHQQKDSEVPNKKTKKNKKNKKPEGKKSEELPGRFKQTTVAESPASVTTDSSNSLTEIERTVKPEKMKEGFVCSSNKANDSKVSGAYGILWFLLAALWTTST